MQLFRKLPEGVCEPVHDAPSGLPGVLLDSSNTNESSFISMDGGLCKVTGKGLRGLGSAVVKMA